MHIESRKWIDNYVRDKEKIDMVWRQGGLVVALRMENRGL